MMGILGKIFTRKNENKDKDYRLENDTFPGAAEVEARARETESEVDERRVQRQADTLKFDALRALRIGESEFAVRALRKSLELHDEFECRYYLAEALLARGMTLEALAEMDILLRELPKHVPTLNRRARTLLEEGKAEEALADTERAWETPPEEQEEWLPSLLLTRAKALQALGRIEDAITLIETTSVDETQEGALRLLLAELFLQAGRETDALHALSGAEELLPEEERIPLLRGRIALAAGQTAKAHLQVDEALALDPFSHRAYLLKADAFVAEGKRADAVKTLTEANEDLEPDTALLTRLSELLDEDGQTDAADKVRAMLNRATREPAAGEVKSFDNLYQGGIY